MVGKDRSDLTKHYNESMFGNVYLDDVEMLAQIGYRFAHDEGAYDVIYRTKLYGKDEYRLVHAVGRFQDIASGVRVAFLTYSDVTEVQKKIYDNSLEINDPKVNFFNENLGPMLVIAAKDNRLLYYNQAVCRMIPPKANFDSGITYQQFFFPDFPEGIKGLMDAVNCSPRVVKEPYTNRNLEISVIASNWNKEKAYVIYFYEVFSENLDIAAETMLRHRRMAFNNVMFAGKQSGFSYSEKGHQGFRIWNLSKNEAVYFEEFSLLDKKESEQVTFEEYFNNLKIQCAEYEDKIFLEAFTRQQMISLYQFDNYPRNRIINIHTSQGMIYVSLEIIMMQSPDTGDVYVKIWEENITDKEIIRVLASKAVEQEFDYIAYLDVLADSCWIIYGKMNDSRDKILYKKVSEFSQSAEFYQKLAEFLNEDFTCINEAVDYIVKKADDTNCFSTIKQMTDGKIKRLHIQIIDLNSPILYIRCADITEFLLKEKEREKELELARNNAIEANHHLRAAVQAEREKVEAILVQTVLAASKALDAKDPYTCRHSERVAQYASEIARNLNLEEKKINSIYNISLVHDIGKIGIPDALLMKPVSLTDSEYELIKEHVKIGSNILRDFTGIENIYEGILYHHERYDGCGYVFGLKAEEIPIEARIIAIADSVDAMYSTRPYRKGQSVEVIINELIKGKGKQFDPKLVDIMIDLIHTGLLELDSES
jgi:response regulator RpfG family c-di-GMP phosphodiesterase